jgi:hypothetical protein
MNPNPESNSMLPAAVPNWPKRCQEVREAEFEAFTACMNAARHAFQHLRGRKFTVAEIGKLLELASKFGRLATGMATEHIEFSTYNDPAFLAQLQKECEAVFSEPIDIESEKIAGSNGSPTT